MLNCRIENERKTSLTLNFDAGKTEHVDAFGFVHSLPNEALQVEYLCNHLREAYDIIIEMNGDNQKNLSKWKKCIMDSSEDVSVETWC